MSARLDVGALSRACSDAARGLARRDSGSVWQSLLTGLPVGEQGVRYSNQTTIDAATAEGLVLHDWRARREILQPAGDLVREGVEIEGLPEWVDTDAVYSWLEGEHVGDEGCGLLQALGELWAEGETYGGAILVAICDDGVPASEPVNLASLRDVVAWEVLDRWSCWPYRSRGIAGPVDYWTIVDYTSQFGAISPAGIIHPSRVAVHWGSWMPRRWRRFRNGWGCSRLELLRDQRDSLAVGFAMLGRLLSKASQDVITVAELSEMIDEVGPGLVKAKMAEAVAALQSHGALVLDGGIEGDPNRQMPGRSADVFQAMARPLNGADKITDQSHIEWRRGSSMPPVIADGEVNGGINSGEEAGAWRAWGATIHAEQRRSLTRHLIWGLELGFAAAEGPTQGKHPGNYTAEWCPIAEPDHKYEAEVALLEQRADDIAGRSGTLSKKERRKWRNVEGRHGAVRVESAELPEPEQPTVQPSALGGGLDPGAATPGDGPVG